MTKRDVNTADPKRSIADLVFVSVNRHVVALDRYTGEMVWSWKAPKGSGFVALFVDGDRLIASVQGYTFCLDPLFGQVVWRNDLTGMGVGVPCIASVNGTSATGASVGIAAAAAKLAADRRAAAAAAAG